MNTLGKKKSAAAPGLAQGLVLCAAGLFTAAAGCGRESAAATFRSNRIEMTQIHNAERAFKEIDQLDVFESTLKRLAPNPGSLTSVTANLYGFGLCFKGVAWFETDDIALPSYTETERAPCP